MSTISNQIEIEELNCPICQEHYDNDERNPKMLLCGHTYCSGCLRTLLQEEESLCPECRCDINDVSVESLPVCYIVKKIVDSVKAINDVRVRKCKNTPGTEGKEGAYLDGDFPSMGTCSDHNAPKHFWCSVCKIWICGTCTILNHQKSLCKAVLIEHPVAVSILIENEKNQVNSQKEILLQVSKFLDECRKLNYPHISTRLNYRTSVCYKSMLIYLSSELKNNKESMEILDDALISMDDIGKRKTLNDWQNVIKYVKNLWCCQQYPKSIEDILQDFWKNAVSEGEIILWMKKLKKRFVFIENVNGEKREAFGTFQLENDIYMIPSLQRYIYNINRNSSLYIPIHFSSVCDCMYTFMELSDNGEYVGTIIFKLSAGCRSQHFRKLCTGEEGPSYKGTKFFNDGGNYNCFLAGGDYENNNGSGGKCLFPFVDDCVGEMREGIVCGNHSGALSHLGQFKIFYECRGNFSSNARGIMAEVVQGLQIVQDIARSGRFTNVIISECGIAFHLSSV